MVVFRNSLKMVTFRDASGIIVCVLVLCIKKWISEMPELPLFSKDSWMNVNKNYKNLLMDLSFWRGEKAELPSPRKLYRLLGRHYRQGPKGRRRNQGGPNWWCLTRIWLLLTDSVLNVRSIWNRVLRDSSSKLHKPIKIETRSKMKLRMPLLGGDRHWMSQYAIRQWREVEQVGLQGGFTIQKCCSRKSNRLHVTIFFERQSVTMTNLGCCAERKCFFTRVHQGLWT